MARISLAQILDTACQLFAQRGIQAVTTAHIAQAAQISVGSLFRYVSTKEELLREAASHAQLQLCKGIKQGPNFPRDTVYDTVRRVWEAAATRALVAPSLFVYWVLAGARPASANRTTLSRGCPCFAAWSGS